MEVGKMVCTTNSSFNNQYEVVSTEGNLVVLKDHLGLFLELPAFDLTLWEDRDKSNDREFKLKRDDYLIEENKHHGFTVTLASTASFGDQKLLTYHGPTIGNKKRFVINGFIHHTRLVADCSNLTCYFPTEYIALRAIEINEGK